MTTSCHIKVQQSGYGCSINCSSEPLSTRLISQWSLLRRLSRECQVWHADAHARTKPYMSCPVQLASDSSERMRAFQSLM